MERRAGYYWILHPNFSGDFPEVAYWNRTFGVWQYIGVSTLKDPIPGGTPQILSERLEEPNVGKFA